ncbi:hypothetical protein WN51_12942 [Melipona quadrifasciata]|uniref:Uncharacterized protein n=1 Tax=Melipona quadrifasciata TaxID=166423 RepID=A0A0M9ACQ4_9HYME|nr:hypothetical protein WN51_12942 [Melipona quadrifasciata]
MTADSLFETTSIPGHLAPTPQRLERLLSKQTLEELYEVEEQPFARENYTSKTSDAGVFIRDFSTYPSPVPLMHCVSIVEQSMNRIVPSGDLLPTKFTFGKGPAAVSETSNSCALPAGSNGSSHSWTFLGKIGKHLQETYKKLQLIFLAFKKIARKGWLSIEKRTIGSKLLSESVRTIGGKENETAAIIADYYSSIA